MRAEIHQQRIRRGVIGFVGFIIKGAGVFFGHVEVSAIQYEISLDLTQPLLPQIAQQEPERFQRDLGVAIALEYQIALEPLALDRAVGVHLSFPLISRAEYFERGIGGEQLHHRSGVH